MNERGKAVEQTMFTHLEIGTAEFETGSRKTIESGQRVELQGQQDASNVAKSPQEGGWMFKKLPDGFTLSMLNRLPDPNGSQMIEQYVLTDGLASLSVFVESGGKGEALKGVSRLGAINAWGGELDGYQVTVVGEVPAMTLLGIVDAMQLKP